jgi:hypothetical protein
MVVKHSINPGGVQAAPIRLGTRLSLEHLTRGSVDERQPDRLIVREAMEATFRAYRPDGLSSGQCVELVARAIVRDADCTGIDLSFASQGVVEGACDAADALGMPINDAASIAVTSALVAAAELGTKAIEQVYLGTRRADVDAQVKLLEPLVHCNRRLPRRCRGVISLAS